MNEPIEVKFEARTTDNAKVNLQVILDELYEVGVLTMKADVKEAKINVKPYNRNTFKVFVVFD